MQLRKYQEDLIDKVRSEIKSGKRSVCSVLGCGGGKSVIQGVISKNATDKGSKVLFLVHRKELCEQITETFDRCGVDFDKCNVSMVQTVTRHLEEIEQPDIIITDEAHHSTSESYLRIYKKFPEALRLGFTATPVRMNEGGLGKVFDSLVESVSTKWLIENNYLSPYRYYSAKLADASEVKVRAGDYSMNDLAVLMEKNVIYGETIKNYRNIADGKKTIVYCASIQASKSTSEEFNSNGIVSAHLDGETPKAIRKETLDRFRRGDITVLCNVDLFGEGLDVPDCECVILLRPTKSLTLFIQQSMRSMRYKEGKTAYIIDHVANVFEHGLPDDSREWNLKSRKGKKKNTVSIRECPVCFGCMEGKQRICEYCGHEFATQEQHEKELRDLELQEVTPDDVLKAKPNNYYKQIKDFDELKRFAKIKGYKFAWVVYKCKEIGMDIPSNYNTYLKISESIKKKHINMPNELMNAGS